MFNLHQVEATCANFSPNTEKHGDEAVNVGDISLSVNIANEQLEQFDSCLRDALFQAPKRSGEQPQLVGQVGGVGLAAEHEGILLDPEGEVHPAPGEKALHAVEIEPGEAGRRDQ